MALYRIRNWSANFENNKSRVMRSCRYVCMPNKQDGMGLTRILAQPDGAMIFGIWCLVLQACSRQAMPREGWLTEDGTAAGRPWDLEDLAFRWRRPLAEIERCLAFVCSDKIGWMERLEANCPSSGTSRAISDGKCQTSVIEGRKEEREPALPDEDDPNDLTKPTPSTPIPAEHHLRRLKALGLWLKDDEERDVAIEAIGLYGGAAMEARAVRLKRDRGTGRIFLNELTVHDDQAAPPPASGESQRAAIAGAMVKRLGWERCADAADIPRERIGGADTMIEAMRDPGIFARVVAATGTAS